MTNKISSETVQALMAQNSIPNVITLRCGTVSIQVKTSIRFAESVSFIDTVADSCFTDDGQYVPAYKELAFAFAFLHYFTDIAVPTKPDDESGDVYDLEAAYDIVHRSNLINRVKKECPALNERLNKLSACINKQIDFKKDRIIHQSPWEDLMTDIRALVGNLAHGIDAESLRDAIPALVKLSDASQQDIIHAVVDKHFSERD